MSTHPIHVFSEIGKLKKVCLHRPGKELENLMPDYLERLLFDDIPFLEDAQKEHDNFAQALRNEGIEVLYLEKLAAESLTTPEIREQFIEEYLDEEKIRFIVINTIGKILESKIVETCTIIYGIEVYLYNTKNKTPPTIHAVA